jgi:hypothetical protein
MKQAPHMSLPFTFCNSYFFYDSRSNISNPEEGYDLRNASLCDESQNSSVRIVTCCRLDGSGSFPGKGSISYLHSVLTGSGVSPTYYPMGSGVSILGVKVTEARNWPLNSAEVKNCGATSS